MAGHPQAAGGWPDGLPDPARCRTHRGQGPGSVRPPQHPGAPEAHDGAPHGRRGGRRGAAEAPHGARRTAAREASERPEAAGAPEADADPQGLQEVLHGAGCAALLGGALEAYLRAEIRLDPHHRHGREQEARGRREAEIRQRAADEDAAGLGALAHGPGQRLRGALEGAPHGGRVARVVGPPPGHAAADRRPAARHSDEGRERAPERRGAYRRDAPRRGRTPHGRARVARDGHRVGAASRKAGLRGAGGLQLLATERAPHHRRAGAQRDAPLRALPEEPVDAAGAARQDPGLPDQRLRPERLQRDAAPPQAHQGRAGQHDLGLLPAPEGREGADGRLGSGDALRREGGGGEGDRVRRRRPRLHCGARRQVALQDAGLLARVQERGVAAAPRGQGGLPRHAGDRVRVRGEGPLHVGRGVARVPPG
mmetsp:Transcript_9335/g.27702  ORF Transcript_9335/g.27702 Transcript_9335/m.27702 type:complete len:425 (+) Transcript_9335:295-1569(+)